MPYCNVNKANIYYEDIGVGIPIIILHGFSPDHRLMKGCMEPIFVERAGWRRIYIDLPGMGQTKDYEQISNSDEMLEAVVDFINAIIPNQPYLMVGESYGGYITRGVIKQQKDQVMGAAFICPMIIPEKQHRTLPKHTNIFSDDEFLTKLTKEERDDFTSTQVVLDEYNWNRYLHEVLAGCQVANHQFLDKVQKHYGFSFSIDELVFDKPCVFLLGKQDSIVGYKDAFAILDKFPRATFAVLDRAGHNLQIEQADLLNAHISEWLSRVDEFKK